MNPQLTDEDLLKLIPIKRRRNSDPDYDVPRSHRSLVNLSVKREETSLSATRFFGPPLEDSNETSESDYSVCFLSMTPDSLEPDYPIKKAKNFKKRSVCTTVIPESVNALTENELYEDPSALSSEKNRSFTIERVDHSVIVCNKNNSKKSVDEKEEEFIDSLETSNNEIKTIF